MNESDQLVAKKLIPEDAGRTMAIGITQLIAEVGLTANFPERRRRWLMSRALAEQPELGVRTQSDAVVDALTDVVLI